MNMDMDGDYCDHGSGDDDDNDYYYYYYSRQLESWR